MDKPKNTKTAIFTWGSLYLMCSFIFFLVLIIIAANVWQKSSSDGLLDIILAIGVLLQGLMVFAVTKTLDATNRMCAYLVEVAHMYEQKEDSTGFKQPWACPICQQQNNYWDEKCVKCGQRR